MSHFATDSPLKLPLTFFLNKPNDFEKWSMLNSSQDQESPFLPVNKPDNFYGTGEEG